jgi:eukaryotic-like serine/threonine-protein kinase
MALRRDEGRDPAVTPERWRAITAIFHGAIAHEAAARAAFVAEACKGDHRLLREEVEAMIAPHENTGLFGTAPVLTSPSGPLTPGTQLGAYCIEALIGAGGMGEVYRARDTRLDRTVAIKTLPLHLRQTGDLQARLEREARAISRLAHPHICTIHDIGRQDDVDFLVMEHLEGETLAARLARARMPLNQALQIAIEIASPLDHAHRHGIDHRDLKPSNVMLTETGAKLLDFGLAKLAASMTAPAGDQSTVQTAKGSLVGTLAYMAPEQVEGKDVDTRADVWAFGCVLYELVTGRAAFDASSQAALIARIVEHVPAPVTSSNPKLPSQLDRLIAICLAKRPDDRWQSARDLTRELKMIADRANPKRVKARRQMPVRLGLVTPAVLVVGVAVMTLRPRQSVSSRPTTLTRVTFDNGLKAERRMGGRRQHRGTAAAAGPG